MRRETKADKGWEDEEMDIMSSVELAANAAAKKAR